MLQLLEFDIYKLLEIYLQSPILALSLPVLQFILIRTAGVYFATVTCITTALVLPCLRLSGNETHNPLNMIIFLAVVLRMWDYGLLPNSIILELDFWEFVTYLISFQLPERLHISMSIAKNVEKHAVPYQNQNLDYFAKEIITNTLKMCFYFAVMKHLRATRQLWEPPVLTLTDFTDLALVFDMFTMGLALSLIMEVGCSALMHFTCYILKIPYMPIMNQPYLATSVRDFWANRWNMIVQRGLRRILFDPIMKLFAIHYPLKSGEKVANWILILAVFSTFLFSALMHEWTMVAIMARPTTWEQFSFFVLHGILSISENVARKFVYNLTGIDLTKWIPHSIQVIYAQIIMVWTAPLFINPYIREKIYFEYSFFA
jgi:hypothetical protein